MEQKGLIEEVRTMLQDYRETLAPGTYLFAPEVQRGKMTGRIIETRSDNPEHYVYPAAPRVTLGFFPLGFVPASMKGAPPSWLSGYPYLPSLEKLVEAPQAFLEMLRRHMEVRAQLADEADAAQPARQWATGENAESAEVSP
jgi:hypothetical protein